ncbi:MAG TPA: BNR-4 repeat-containing protein [Planctomycetota bacterium]|nr:BNR-4 repeat-containing protein [Planctomycetota bacterium]
MLLLLACLGLQDPLPRDDGYRGLWYMNQPEKTEHRYKYSGGFATYPQQHVPIAIHVAAAGKTFFVYGGRPKDANRLLHMVSYVDHATGEVPRPAILLDKKTDDAHDNPVLAVDGRGHLWVFSNAHGTGRPAFIHRSVRPHDIDVFEKVVETNFSYGQPWTLPGDGGFLFLHTRYLGGRQLHWMTSPDGRTWSEPQCLARAESGHYQVSARQGRRVATIFNVHPKPVGLNARTNLYYVETRDGGATWTTASGEALPTPIESVQSPALVKDYRAEGLLVYLKDLVFDGDGRPVALFLTSRGYAPGPSNGPRLWRTARWTGSAWEIRDVTASDHNYDYGFLSLDGGRWRLLATTEPGPQPWGTGGDIAVWESADAGATWAKKKVLTSNSRFNHHYPRRPVDAHPDVQAIWADGNPLEPSESSLYVSDGERVWRLPSSIPAGRAPLELLR